MTPENKVELQRLFKKIALICLLLALAAGVLMYFVSAPTMQLVIMSGLLLAAGGSGYRCAMLSPLWAATAGLKGLLCLFAVLTGVAVASMTFSVGALAYAMASGKVSNGSAGGGFSSRSFD